MDRCLDGWILGWMDGGMDRQIDRLIHVIDFQLFEEGYIVKFLVFPWISVWAYVVIAYIFLVLVCLSVVSNESPKTPRD